MGIKLIAKITKKYFDQILSGEKTTEFRQFDGSDIIELHSNDGRILEARISKVEKLTVAYQKYMIDEYDDVNFKNNIPIYAFMLKNVKEIK